MSIAIVLEDSSPNARELASISRCRRISKRDYSPRCPRRSSSCLAYDLLADSSLLEEARREFTARKEN